MTRASPDQGLSALTRLLGCDGSVVGDLWIHKRVASTNGDLLQQAQKGAGDWSISVAEAQSSGRGRRGRSWASPFGVNLYLSVLTPSMTHPAQGARLPILAAVAGAEALEQQQVSVGLKWPNDLIGESGGKLGGILAETANLGRAVIGLGLNVNAERTQLVAGSVSLRTEFGGGWDRADLAYRFIQRLQAWWPVFEAEGFATVAQAWWHRALWRGQFVRVVAEAGEWTGRLDGLDEWGRIRLETVSGEKRLSAGEVSIRAG